MTGLRVAILAILFHPAMLGTRGSVCLDAIPLPLMKAICPDPCCAPADPAEGCCPDEGRPDRSAPPGRALPACCIWTFDLGYLGGNTVAVPAPQPAPGFLWAPRAPAQRLSVAAASSQRPRPPPLDLVGVVLLQV